ncbi:CheR family methyltransferase [Thermodesulfobacteriota bacterium]
MAHAAIEAILGQAIGLKISSIGQSTLDRAINQRLRALEMSDLNEYILKLKASPTEVKELIEEVVVPETWFFRNKEPFLALVDFVKNKWSHQTQKKLLRILSAPCSTGEEPYSVSMTLLHAGWPESRFHVDALDISSRSLSKAKTGEYGDHSFREKDFNYCFKYFTNTEDGKYILHERVRKKVSFFQGNLLNPSFIDRLGFYDVIFCRNLLIYLDPKSQARAVKTLGNLLLPNGILFTGHAEASLLSEQNFSSSPYPKAFAFHKQDAPPAMLVTKPQIPDKSDPFPIIDKPFKPAQAPDFGNFRQPIPSPSRPEIETAPDDMTVARKLADQGQLMESARICEEDIRKNGPTAQSYFLLGIIHDVNGDTQKAMEFLRKAIYLDPNHQEALVLLSLVLERSGNESGAESMRRRAERARARLSQSKEGVPE